MLADNTLITVFNRNNGSTGYVLPELHGLKRHFAPAETKQIEMGELRKLSYQTSGRFLLNNYLVLFNKEAVEELVGEVEPEYYYTNKDIEDLLINGTLNQLDDCLTFAPAGVVETLKSIAVTIKLNDMSKRELIFNKTGFNIDGAIRNNKYAEDAEKAEQKPETKQRKAAVPGQSTSESVQTPEETKPEAPQRKAAAPKYKVTSTTV